MFGCLMISVMLTYGLGGIAIIIGIVVNDNWLISAGTAFVLFLAQPLIPMWLIIPSMAIGISKLLGIKQRLKNKNS